MTDPAILRYLLERIEAATGPDRELDAAIAKAFGFSPISKKNIYRRNLYPLQLIRVKEIWAPLTASIDSALALVEKMLPGWNYQLTSVVFGRDVFDHGPMCELHNPISSASFMGEQYLTLNSIGRNREAMPHAILSALLRALLASPGDAR